MIATKNVFTVAEKASKVKGVKSVNVTANSDGLVSIHVYSKPLDYTAKDCRHAWVYLGDNKEENITEINHFFNRIKRWSK
jgi:hypothetical protein